jgi:hypothetical protein
VRVEQDEKSGAGYGNHGGDGSMGGQDGEKSKDHEQGKSNDTLDSGRNEPEPGADRT